MDISHSAVGGARDFQDDIDRMTRRTRSFRLRLSGQVDPPGWRQWKTVVRLAGAALWIQVHAAEAQTEPAAQEFAQAAANTSETSGHEVLYVTARRQLERAEDVPISLTPISGNTLDADQVNSLLGLPQFIPGLQVLSFNPRNTAITIRGLGANIGIANDGIEPGVGIYVDGVLYARPGEALFDIPDISSVEELRGPQGTLYGKNTVAGAININTAPPGEIREARASAALGSFGYQRYMGSVSGPVTEDGALGVRLSALYSHHDGFFHNVTTGQWQGDFGDFSARAQISYRALPDFSVRLIGDYESYYSLSPVREISGVITTLANGQAVPRNFFVRSQQAGYTPLPINPYARLTDTNSPVYSRMQQGGFSAEGDWSFDGYALTSITAVRSWTWRPANDDDLTALSVLAQSRMANDEREVTQEFRVVSPDDRAVVFNAGLYYLWEQDDGAGTLEYGADAPLWLLGSSSAAAVAAIDGYTITARSNPRVNSYAAYGEATWHVSPHVDVIGGGRFTYEYKTGGYQQQASGASLAGLSAQDQTTANAIRSQLGIASSYSLRTANDLVGGLVTVTYRFDGGPLGYASYSRGEKSAGLNLANLSPAAPKIVAPESVDDYEIGLKYALADHRLTVNADAFWIEDSNYQTTVFDNTNFGIYLANIPGVRSRGIESAITFAAGDGLSGFFSAAYTDAIYESYPNAPAPFEDYTVSGGKLNTNVTVDLSGRGLAAVSKWAISLGGEYSQPLERLGLPRFVAYFGADDSYRSGYFSQTVLSLFSRVQGYDVLNLHAGLRADDGHWDLELWVRNALDARYRISQVPLVFNSGALSAIVGDPRMYGAALTVRL